MKIQDTIKYIVILLLLPFLFPFEKISAQEQTEYLQGKVVEILEEKEVEYYEQKQLYQNLKISVTKGILKGEEIDVENGATQSTQVIKYNIGDNLVITYDKDAEGNDVYYITDYVRTSGLFFLVVLFVILALMVGGKKSFFSIIAMIFSFVVLFYFVLPKIQEGINPVFISIIGSIIIVPITFYLSHGFEKKTTVAMIGTFISLIITGVLTGIFVKTVHLAGTDSEEAMFLQTMSGTKYNLQGILISGIILGTLGVMDDITVSQTSIVYQLFDLKKDISFAELFKRSIEVGKDHIASVINTLVLAYTGASLPLLLLFINAERSFSEVINLDIVSTEIVRTLVGSIGLILTIPVTTYIACITVMKENTNILQNTGKTHKI